MVQLKLSEIHNDLMMIKMDVSDNVSIERLEEKQLPKDWKSYPGPDYLKQIGNAWLKRKSALLLYVPCVIDPMAQNVLINPLHPEIKELKLLTMESFSFDERLLHDFEKK